MDHRSGVSRLFVYDVRMDLATLMPVAQRDVAGPISAAVVDPAIRAVIVSAGNRIVCYYFRSRYEVRRALSASLYYLDLSPTLLSFYSTQDYGEIEIARWSPSLGLAVRGSLASAASSSSSSIGLVFYVATTEGTILKVRTSKDPNIVRTEIVTRIATQAIKEMGVVAR